MVRFESMAYGFGKPRSEDEANCYHAVRQTIFRFRFPGPQYRVVRRRPRCGKMSFIGIAV
jgi:hypothetical protein